MQGAVYFKKLHWTRKNRSQVRFQFISIYPSHPRACVVFANLHLLEYFTKAFLQEQLGFIAVFVQLHEFLQEQVCDRTKIFVVENGN